MKRSSSGGEAPDSATFWSRTKRSQVADGGEREAALCAKIAEVAQVESPSGAPLYLRMAEAIRAEIASGALGSEQRLPTVRALSRATGASEGTIRHAYEALARSGELVTARGKGTRVRAPESMGRKERALSAIDDMLSELDALGFSPREARLFISVRLDSWQSRWQSARPVLRVALVDCCPEVLNESAARLSESAGVELSEFLLGEVERAPELLKDYPLVVTTQSHADKVALLLPGGDRLQKVLLSPSQRTIIALARAEAEGGVGVYCRTRRFLEITMNGMRAFPHLRTAEAKGLLAGEPLASFLRGVRTLIVAPDYLAYTSGEDRDLLEEFAASGGVVIPYHYEIDRGSLMYLEERIRALLEAGPGMD